MANHRKTRKPYPLPGITVKRVVRDVDFRRIMRHLEVFSRSLVPGEGILLLNHRLTRWRIIGPHSDGGYVEMRGYAPKGRVYDLPTIEEMVAMGFVMGLTVPPHEAAKIDHARAILLEAA